MTVAMINEGMQGMLCVYILWFWFKTTNEWRLVATWQALRKMRIGWRPWIRDCVNATLVNPHSQAELERQLAAEDEYDSQALVQRNNYFICKQIVMQNILCHIAVAHVNAIFECLDRMMGRTVAHGQFVWKHKGIGCNFVAMQLWGRTIRSSSWWWWDTEGGCSDR